MEKKRKIFVWLQPTGQPDVWGHLETFPSVSVSSKCFFLKASRRFQVFLKQQKQFIFQGKLDHLKFCLCRLKKVFWTKPQCFLYLNQPESHTAATHPAELISDSAGKYEHLIWWAGWTNTSSQLTVKHNMLNIHKQSSGVNAERELVFVSRSIIAGEPSKRRRGG